MLKHRRGFSIGALLLVLSLVAAACGDDDTGTTEGTEGTTATTAAASTTEAPATTQAPATTEAPAPSGLAPGTYTFGFTAVTSGPVAFAGVPHQNGLELAEREINASGFLGEGVEIEFLIEDAGGDQAAAIAINDNYIANDDVLGLVCCALSSVAGAIQPNVAAAGLAWVDHAAIAPTITDPDNAFRSFPLSQPSTAAIAEAAIAAFAPANAVVTVTADNDGLLSDRDANLGALDAAGVEVLGVIDTFAEDTDMSGAATQVIALNPDIVFMAQLGNTEVLMVQELRDRGYAGPIVGNLAIATAETWDQAGETLLGTILPLAFFAGNPDPMVQEFAALYEAEYGTTPDIFAAQDWQVAWFMATALKNGGEGTRDAVLQGVRDIDSMDTVFGTLTWDERGEATIEQWTFVQWSADGELVLWDGTAEGLLANINE
jgi:ABC-type branched-subunit amino acid transport system substrate-binding protein